MNILGIKKKKEVSDEKKVARAKVIVLVFLVMIAIILIPTHRKDKSVAADSTPQAMDLTLDSLLAAIGYDQCEVTYRGPIETLVEEPQIPQKTHLTTLELQMQMYQSMSSITASQRQRLLDDLNAQREALIDSIAMLEAAATPREYTCRRIRFTTPDGRSYTFFQNLYLEDNTTTASYLMETTASAGDAAAQLQRLDSLVEDVIDILQ